jgi:eukaryotic-like serine/threonine-protein kinase
VRRSLSSHRSRPPIDGGAEERESMVGRTAGPFQLEAMIASGGFGTIYRALGGVAVKVLHADLAGSAEAIARFEREIDVLRRVSHPGLVEIHACGRLDDGRPYFAMELLEGHDLDAHIARRGRLSPAACLAVLEPLCETLAAAHDAGVIHRDVKASNVFLADDGRVLLLDFGIAKLLDPNGAGLTASRQALGSPSCMAPEQIGGRPATPRSDVYGLGALVYHMLTGAPAFADASASVSATVLQYLHAHARRPLATARASLPAAIDEVIASAMALEPERRHPGPRELLAACRAALGQPDAERSTRPALIVRVDVRVTASDDGDLAAALDDADAVWSAARAHFSTRGFTPALEASETILFVRPLSDEPGESDPSCPPSTGTRPHPSLTSASSSASAPSSAARDSIAEFEELIASRAGRHPSVTVSIEARPGEAAFSGNMPVGGSLLDLGPKHAKE